MLKPDAVIMASGFSSRMGANKLLLEINGKPVIQRFLDNLPLGIFRKVVLVYSEKSVADACEGYGIELVENTAPEEMKSGTIKHGVQACEGASGLMFFVADQPCLKRETIETLVSVYRRNSKKIIIPISAGKGRNPVIFPESTFAELKELEGDNGGKKVMKTSFLMLILKRILKE
jgi:molybdenum cofactor cytidylyltransferase